MGAEVLKDMNILGLREVTFLVVFPVFVTLLMHNYIVVLESRVSHFNWGGGIMSLWVVFVEIGC